MSENGLPNGWTTCTVGELGVYQNGRAFSNREWGQVGRPIIRIQNLTGTGKSFNRYDGHVEEKHLVRPGDLLVSWAATLGVFVWHGEEAALNQHIFKVTSSVDQNYHRYVLEWALESMMRNTHGSGMVHITKGKFDATEVPLAPRSEQARIVDELERRLSHVEQAILDLEAAAIKVKQLREAILWSAVMPSTGGVDDRGLPTLVEGWEWTTLGAVADVAGGVTKDAKRQSDPHFVEVPYLRVANVQLGFLKLDEVTSIRVHPDKAKALRLEVGDILFNEGGDRDKLGRGWIWEGQVNDCIHQNHVFRARLKEPRLHPKFVSWVGNTFGRKWFEAAGKQTTNLASINKTVLESFPIPMPQPGSASKIVIDVERRLSLVEAAEMSIFGNLREATNLRRSLLAAAFSGKLVSQDDRDEPADVLLARIREEREAGARTANGKTPRCRDPRKKREVSA